MIREANMMLTDAASHMVCGIYNTTPEDGVVATKTFYLGRSIGNGDEVA